jgi:acetylornithine/N-succinyldiaminopimelate aminotransferase
MAGFAPMLSGFDQVSFGNLNEMRAMISDQTAAILVEPIQGEGGINHATDDYLNELRDIADEFALLLFLDEVQTGMGRTGKLFSYQWSNIKPDVLAIAKGLGGGFPVGACIASEEVSSTMTPGSHGSTFGGNPMAMAAANAVLDVMLEDGFFEHVQTMSGVLKEGLLDTAKTYPKILGKVRGKGLLSGIECKSTNSDLVKKLEEMGLLTVAAGNNVVRFIPPLTVQRGHIEEAISLLQKACADLAN